MPVAPRDYNRYYKDTYIRYKGDPVYTLKVEEDGWAVSKLVDGTWNSFKTDLSTLDLSYPDLGLIDVGNLAVYVSRQPSRQWKKGFRSSSVTLRALNFISSSPIENYHEHNIATALLSTRKTRGSPTEIYDMLMDDVITASRLNGSFAMSKWYTSKGGELVTIPVIVYKTHIVGTVEQGGNGITTAILPKSVGYLQDELSTMMNCSVKGG